MHESVIALAVWSGLAAASLPILYLVAATFAAVLGQRRAKPADRRRRIAILIPAHNEELLIADTVSNARRQDYPDDSMLVFVIADNCSDKTAALASVAGARVFVRTGNPGKGQGLYDAFELLLKEDWEAFLVMDADSHLHPGALSAINDAIEAGSQALQIRYGVLNPDESIRTRAMELSTASFNALRPLGKVCLGLSAGINGNGFCLTRETVERVPYLAHSIVEDIEYHMLLLKSGIKVGFLDHVWVKAQMPVGGRGATVQRVRWERGRIITIRNYAPALFSAWRQGQSGALDGLIDVLMPPVSLVFLALLPGVFAADLLPRILAMGGMAIMFLHYLIAAFSYGNMRSFFLLLLYVPWYVFWKTVVVIRSLVTEKNLPWIRTDRNQ